MQDKGSEKRWLGERSLKLFSIFIMLSGSDSCKAFLFPVVIKSVSQILRANGFINPSITLFFSFPQLLIL